MNLQEALETTLNSQDHHRSYIYATRPFTLDSPAFIEASGNLGWEGDTYDGTLPMGMEVVGYLKDIRIRHMMYAGVDENTALERLVEYYEERHAKTT